MKRFVYISALIVISTIMLTDPSPAQQAGGETSTEPREPAIGCLIPLSGPKAAYGNEALMGALVAVGALESSRGEPGPKLLIEDTHSDPEVARHKVEELVERGAVAIFGTLTEPEAAAAAEAAQNEGIPIILMNRGASLVTKGQFVFHNFIDPEAEVKTLMDFARAAKGINSFGCLFPDNAYGQEYSRLFKAYLGTYGFDAPCHPYPTDAVDFKEQILELRARLGRRVTNYAIFVPDFPSRLRLLLPQVFFWELEGVVFLGAEGWCSHELHEKMPKYTKHAMFVCPFWPDDPRLEVISFEDKFQKALKRQPTLIAAFAHDNAKILIHCAEKKTDPEAIKSCLSSLKNFRTVCGKISFTPNGRGVRNLRILKFDRSGNMVRVQ